MKLKLNPTIKCARHTQVEAVHLNETAAKFELTNCVAEQSLARGNQCSRLLEWVWNGNKRLNCGEKKKKQRKKEKTKTRRHHVRCFPGLACLKLNTINCSKEVTAHVANSGRKKKKKKKQKTRPSLTTTQREWQEGKLVRCRSTPAGDNTRASHVFPNTDKSQKLEVSPQSRGKWKWPLQRECP